MNKRASHGGKRTNAGAKPLGETKKIPYATRLSVEVVSYLKTSENAAKTIETAIVRSAGFKRFDKSQNNP